jgi:hypothetical protein
MPENLREIAAATAEDEEIAAMGIAFETFLNLKRQPLHAAAHVRVARRDPDATARWKGDQDRSAFSVAAINAVGALAPIRIRAPFISTRIAPSSGALVGGGVAIGARGESSTSS